MLLFTEADAGVVVGTRYKRARPNNLRRVFYDARLGIIQVRSECENCLLVDLSTKATNFSKNKGIIACMDMSG